MERKILLQQALQRGNLLNIKNKWYRGFLKNKFIPLIEEDFKKGDITTELFLKNDYIAYASVIAKQNGIIAGLEEAEFLYNQFGIKVISSIKEGTAVKVKDIIIKLKGNIKALLKTERPILDLISRMSGIATMTYNLRMLVKDKIAIAATRKTLLPYIDKKAVFVGGGLTHRLALWDGILIKDNHLKQKNFSLKDFFAQNKIIEIEVKNQSQAIKIITAFKDYKDKYSSKTILIIMFDNMKPSDIKDTIKKSNKDFHFFDNISNQLNHSVSKGGWIFTKPQKFPLETFVGEYILFEGSGNITERNIKEYINIGIDCVSLGILTHSVKSLDLTQKIVCS